jgi:hypothetical protein
MSIERRCDSSIEIAKNVEYTKELRPLKLTRRSLAGSKDLECETMTVTIIGYEVGTQAVENPSGHVTWICQLNNGLRVVAPLRDGSVISAFDAMHFIGRYVKLRYESLTEDGMPLSPSILILRHNKFKAPK